ncbi:hypothetical protein [Streptomyces flavofungini]|uniref:hypothetical protein n=1 Tax=Streptomyces flavofungini TaxID=68200 RepID=UPI0034DF2F33
MPSKALRVSRVPVCAVAGLLAATVLTGCGLDGGDGGKDAARPHDENRQQSPGQVVRATNVKTSEAGSARVRITTTASAKGKSETVTGKGVLDFRGGESRMTLGQAGQRLEQRVVDRTLYQKPPKGEGGLPDGKSWMKIDLERLRTSGASAGTQVSDPADSFAYSKSLSGQDVKKVGEERVGGVRTTHYRVAVDIDKLAKGDAEQKKRLHEQLGDTVPMDLWIDGKGVTRRQQVEMGVRTRAKGEASGSAEVKAKVVMDFSDFGTAVDVDAPAASDTVDVTDKVVKESHRKA